MQRQCLCEKLVKVSLKSVYCSAKIIGSNLFFCYQSIMSLMTVFDMTINGLAWLGVRFDMMMNGAIFIENFVVFTNLNAAIFSL